MKTKEFSMMLAGAMLVVSASTSATNLQGIDGPLPEIVCSRTSCAQASDLPATKSSSANASIAAATATRLGSTKAAALAGSTPSVAAHPPGQRLHWVTPTSPFCQDLGTGTPPVNSYSYTDPPGQYPYLEADSIPVPLGSTDISVLGSMTVNLWVENPTGTDGAAGTYGFLQVRRTGTAAWLNLDTGYTLTVPALAPGTQRSMWGKGSYQGVINLSSLPGASGVPAMIDVRIAAINVITNAVTNVNKNQICNGILDVTF